MNIIELLKLRGFNVQAKTKLVRHQDSQCDLYELMTTGLIETYQAVQSRPVLECDFMVSFIGMPRNQARLIGVYRINGRKKLAEITLPENYPFTEDPEFNYYLLQKEPGFDDLEQRVVIDWGASTRSWHQWLSEKEVTQVLPLGFTRPFPGYLDFILSYDELQKIIEFPEANHEWSAALRNVAGIYLILQPSTGAQYVGSAAGSQGIFGRWSEYAQTGHGGNKLLIELCARNPIAPREFKFSLLRTLSKAMTNREVVDYENFYKKKLGTRAFGLNAN